VIKLKERFLGRIENENKSGDSWGELDACPISERVKKKKGLAHGGGGNWRLSLSRLVGEDLDKVSLSLRKNGKISQ